jgi:hypothetical protein
MEGAWEPVGGRAVTAGSRDLAEGARREREERE